MKRRTPLRQKRPTLRRTAARKAKPRRDQRGRDASYLVRVRAMPCCARDMGLCGGRRHAHHPRHLAPGIARKAPDDCAISLCARHHGELHALSGPFKRWQRQRLRDWQDGWISATRSVVLIQEAGELARTVRAALAEVG